MRVRNNKEVSNYVSSRLQSNRDDRRDRSKQISDAELRGKIGVSNANRIISSIDSLKSYR